MKQETKKAAQGVILAIIERFEDIEHTTGADFIYAKRVIMKWSKEKDIFSSDLIKE